MDTALEEEKTYDPFLEEVVSKVTLLMEKEKLFLDPSLSLYSMAFKCGVTPQKLSSLINGRYSQTFKGFVNKYRIEESQRLLKEHSTLALDFIAKKSGFRSTNAFMIVFKSILGVTPGEYKKKQI